MITGASGRIGTFYRRWLHESGQVGPGDGQWTLRLVDVRPPEDVPAGDEVLAGPGEADLADLEVARRAVAGAEAVLHLAGTPARGRTSTAPSWIATSRPPTTCSRRPSRRGCAG